MVETSTTEAAVIDRDQQQSAPLDAAHARISQLILNYGSACAAYHSGPVVTRAYQACMAEFKKQLGVA